MKELSDKVYEQLKKDNPVLSITESIAAFDLYLRSDPSFDEKRYQKCLLTANELIKRYVKQNPTHYQSSEK